MVIFAIDDEFSLINDTGLKYAIDFCHQKDVEYAQRYCDSPEVLGRAGFGFPRLVLGLGGDSLNILSRLNGYCGDIEEYGLKNTFYSSSSIIYNFETTDEDVIFEKYTSTIDLMGFRFLVYSTEYDTRKCIYCTITYTTKYNKLKKYRKSKKTIIIHVKELTNKLLTNVKKYLDNFYILYDEVDNDVAYEKNLFWYKYSALVLYFNLPSNSPISSAIHLSKKSSLLVGLRNKYTVKRAQSHLKNRITFISYSHKDDSSGAITQMVDEMRTLGINLFFDNLDFLPGQNWDETASIVISRKNCKDMLSIVYSGYLHSEACLVEKEQFLKKSGKTLYLFDPFGYIRDEDNPQGFKSLTKITASKLNEILSKIDPIHEKANNNISGKIVILRNRKDILSIYNHHRMNESLSEKNVVSNYIIDGRKGLKEKYICNVPFFQYASRIKIVKKKKEVFLQKGSENYPIDRGYDKCERYFIGNGVLDLYTTSTTDVSQGKFKVLKTFLIISRLFFLLALVLYIIFGINIVENLGRKNDLVKLNNYDTYQIIVIVLSMVASIFYPLLFFSFSKITVYGPKKSSTLFKVSIHLIAVISSIIAFEFISYKVFDGAVSAMFAASVLSIPIVYGIICSFVRGKISSTVLFCLLFNIGFVVAASMIAPFGPTIYWGVGSFIVTCIINIVFMVLISGLASILNEEDGVYYKENNVSKKNQKVI